MRHQLIIDCCESSRLYPSGHCRDSRKPQPPSFTYSLLHYGMKNVL